MTPMRWIVPAVALLLSPLAAAQPAPRGQIEAGVAWVDEIEGVSSRAAMLSYLTPQTHPWEFAGGHIASRGSGRTVSTPSVTFLSASKRFTWRGWFVQGGLAWTSSDTEVLSRNWQFVTGFGYRFSPHWSLSLRHLSNAGTGGRNRGENLLTLHYGF